MDQRKDNHLSKKINLNIAIIFSYSFVCLAAIVTQQIFFTFIFENYSSLLTISSYIGLVLVNILLVFAGSKFISYKQRK